MAKCNHACGQEADENLQDGFCILHSPNPNKPSGAFNEALKNRPSLWAHNFSHIVFPFGFDFSGVTLNAASFQQARFTGNISFRNSIFHQRTNFGLAEFSGTADFFGATFTDNVDFEHAQFAKAASFYEVKFEGGARFRGITFPERADFYDARFGKQEESNEIDGEKTHSSDIRTADFWETKFEKRANFTCAKFAYKADFSDAEFTKGASFYKAVFTDKAEANFLSTVFAEEVNFVEADFENTCMFEGAIFKQGGIFRGTIFANIVDFRGARFLGATIFKPQKKEGQDPIFSEAKEVFFNDVTIDPLEAVTFKGADLQKCRFQGTDLRKAEITGATWPKIHRVLPKTRARYPGLDELITRIRGYLLKTSTGFGVYDEEVLRKGKSDSWEHIEHLYRQLKQNLEDRRDYERANDFHYGEKEMRRKNPRTFCGLKFLLTVYWAVSGYGERWLRPLVWAVGLLATFAFLYLCVGVKDGSELAWTNLSDWAKALLYSFRVMTLMKPEELKPIDAAAFIHTFIYTLESIIGPILLGLFGLALRQRLKR